jgi:fumarate reductase flavoprotein subunit
MRQSQGLRLLAGVAGLILAGQTLLAGVATPPPLAALHGQKGVTCVECHPGAKGGKVKVDDNERVPNLSCVRCHGDLKAVGAGTPGPLNPHLSHLGETSCTLCHRGHEPSRSYCQSCHAFDMKIPAGAAGPWQPAPKPSPRSKGKVAKADHADVVVVGSGAAGMVAALTAHDAGARVIVLEKQPLTGGNSMLAEGGMNAAHTPAQAKAGIQDTVELMRDDTLKGGKNLGEPALVELLARNSAASVAYLEQLGADLSDVGRLGGASVKRAHRPSGGDAVGAHIVSVLRRNALERKLDVRVNARVVKLLEGKDGRIIGVEVAGLHRGTYRILAKAVVLAAGGFSANPERVAHYQPSFKGMASSNQPGATGDGLDLGEAKGGKLKDMEQIQIHPSIAASSRILITEAVRGNGAILVNREGRRFFNEIGTRDAVSQAILHQTGKTAFLVFDEGVRKSLKQIDGYFHLELVKAGDTPEALARALGLPEAAFKATLEGYNAAFEAKLDPECKRPDLPRALRTPRYYAIEVMPGIHYTMGGLQINTGSQVLDQAGQAIPGFFAAGEVTGGVHGANRLGGNSISETITFGRIAGESAAAFAKASRKP